MVFNGQQEEQHWYKESADKSYVILNKPLQNCGKCGKEYLSKGEVIYYDLCDMWAWYANCV